jgi:hypothetical protein
VRLLFVDRALTGVIPLAVLVSLVSVPTAVGLFVPVAIALRALMMTNSRGTSGSSPAFDEIADQRLHNGGILGRAFDHVALSAERLK